MACRRAEEIDLEVLFREADSPECRDFVAHAGDCADCAAAMQRQREGGGDASPEAPKIAVAGAAVVIIAVVALLALSERSGDAPESAAGNTEEPTAIAEATREIAPGIDALEALQLESGEEREIAAAELPSGRPILLSLRVPVVTDAVGALPVRLIAEDGRVLESTAAIAKGDRGRVDVSVDADWLNRPGRYIVEVKTTEKSHLPLRRYAIVVR